VSDFPAVPLILESKAPSHVQIVVGDLLCQINFLAEVMAPGVQVQRIALDRLEDGPVLEALQLPEPVIFVLAKASCLSLAPDTRAKVRVWSAAPIAKRSGAIRVIVRTAMATVGLATLADEQIDVIGGAILDALGEEALPQALLCEACWHLTGATPGTAPALWIHPWEHPLNWARSEVPLPIRLHGLYKDLVCYVFALSNDWKCAQALGVSPSKFAWLKTLRLDPGRVERAIVVLSRWRGGRAESEQALRVALQISSIFTR